MSGKQSKSGQVYCAACRTNVSAKAWPIHQRILCPGPPKRS